MKYADEVASQDYDDYNYIILQPEISRYFRTGERCKLIKIIQNFNIPEGSNFVMQVPEWSFDSMISRKIYLRFFNCCTVKKYVTILGCYNCQRLFRVARACRKEKICTFCAQLHDSKESHVSPCENEPCYKNYHEGFLYSGNLNDVEESLQHPAYNRNFKTYNVYLKKLSKKHSVWGLYYSYN